MIGRTAMSSFSDAHETVEIPIIAANLNSLILPRQSQIWAVLHGSDSLRRLAYSLAATFLGRMCLSGGIDELDNTQWDLVLAAQRLYRKVVPVIRQGVSRRFGETNRSWRHPRGWQAVVRTNNRSDRVLAVLHTFSQAPEKATLPLPSPPTGRAWQVAETFPDDAFEVNGNALEATLPGDFSGLVVLLEAQ